MNELHDGKQRQLAVVRPELEYFLNKPVLAGFLVGTFSGSGLTLLWFISSMAGTAFACLWFFLLGIAYGNFAGMRLIGMNMATQWELFKARYARKPT